MGSSEKTIGLIQLRALLDEMLLQQQYSSAGRWPYDDIYIKLERYMGCCKLCSYSAQVGSEFLKYTKEKYPSNTEHWKRVNTAVRRFNDLAEGRGYVYIESISSIKPADCFTETVDDYLNYLRIRGKRESSVKLYTEYSIKFLNLIYESGVESVSGIDAAQIYKIYESFPDKANLTTSLRSFLRFAYEKKMLDVDYSGIVPSVRKKQILPSTYTGEEIGKLLDAVDTSCPLGKRDFAVILLALKLGIRSGDIANLKLENIDFDGGFINFVQQKTDTAHKLVLLPDVAAALRDFIEQARPQTESKNVFTYHRVPYCSITPIAVYGIVSRYFRKSGIDTGNKKHGAHSLRMTLASGLVENGVPLDVVRKILGQETPEATKKYVLFKPEMLRKCAVPVPTPGGLLLNILLLRKDDPQ
jgi:site-specific recombinase XerD